MLNILKLLSKANFEMEYRWHLAECISLNIVVRRSARSHLLLYKLTKILNGSIYSQYKELETHASWQSV